jgi:hypothetical protein
VGQLAGYTELQTVGTGGFGRVVLARHDASGTVVAIKYLHQRYLTNYAVLEGFRREAAMMAAVQSPYVVRLFDFHVSPDVAALVMEAVPGVSLRQILEAERALMVEAALSVLKGSLLGLAAAHQVGVVHRDYKPDNVLVTSQGVSKLVDFGLAVLDGQLGLTAGSPSYMAPEQWAGQPGTPATDVYAATCVFYQCITGKKPFVAESNEELRRMHEMAAPDLSQVPQHLHGLIAAGMAKNPYARPTNAGVFVAELERVAVAVHGPDWERRAWHALATAAGTLVALTPLAILAGTATTTVAGTATSGLSALGATGTTAGTTTVSGSATAVAESASTAGTGVGSATSTVSGAGVGSGSAGTVGSGTTSTAAGTGAGSGASGSAASAGTSGAGTATTGAGGTAGGTTSASTGTAGTAGGTGTGASGAGGTAGTSSAGGTAGTTSTSAGSTTSGASSAGTGTSATSGSGAGSGATGGTTTGSGTGTSAGNTGSTGIEATSSSGGTGSTGTGSTGTGSGPTDGTGSPGPDATPGGPGTEPIDGTSSPGTGGTDPAGAAHPGTVPDSTGASTSGAPEPGGPATPASDPAGAVHPGTVPDSTDASTSGAPEPGGPAGPADAGSSAGSAGAGTGTGSGTGAGTAAGAKATVAGVAGAGAAAAGGLLAGTAAKLIAAGLAAAAVVTGGVVVANSLGEEARPAATASEGGEAAPAADCSTTPPENAIPGADREACQWQSTAEQIVGYQDKVVLVGHDGENFEMRAVDGKTGKELWSTGPFPGRVEAPYTPQTEDAPRTLKIIQHEGKPYAAFMYTTDDGVATTIMPIDAGPGTQPVHWELESLTYDWVDTDDAAAFYDHRMLSGTVVDPDTGDPIELPVDLDLRVHAIGDGWFAEGWDDSLVIRDFDGGLLWEVASYRPGDLHSTVENRWIIGAHGEYVLLLTVVRPPEGGLAPILSVHDRTGRVVAETLYGDNATFDATVVASPNQQWLAVHAGTASAAINLETGHAQVLDDAVRPLTISDDGQVVGVVPGITDKAVVADGHTGQITWEGDRETRLPHVVGDGYLVINDRIHPVLSNYPIYQTGPVWALRGSLGG